VRAEADLEPHLRLQTGAAEVSLANNKRGSRRQLHPTSPFRPRFLPPEVSGLQHSGKIISSATFLPTQCLIALRCYLRSGRPQMNSARDLGFLLRRALRGGLGSYFGVRPCIARVKTTTLLGYERVRS